MDDHSTKVIFEVDSDARELINSHSEKVQASLNGATASEADQLFYGWDYVEAHRIINRIIEDMKNNFIVVEIIDNKFILRLSFTVEDSFGASYNKHKVDFVTKLIQDSLNEFLSGYKFVIYDRMNDSHNLEAVEKGLIDYRVQRVAEGNLDLWQIFAKKVGFPYLVNPVLVARGAIF